MPFDLKMNDFSGDIIKAYEEAMEVSGEAVGLAMETHVSEGAPVGTPESTGVMYYHGGNLKRSITHKVIGDTVYVGTNLKAENGYPSPVAVEYGTGIYADGGRGRQTPWVWKDKNGEYHYTHGMKPTHFMRNALQRSDHVKEYKDIYENQLKKVKNT